jgi:hypothetical protein
MEKTKYVEKGEWRTLEQYWNATGTAFFKAPAGAQIKLRYGYGWFGKDRQKQTLDGVDVKRLCVGLWSVSYARMQIKVPVSTDVTYSVFPGNVAITTPEIDF